MVKRITYLSRRNDLSSTEFRQHWSTIHADIARDLPRVLSYRQNHIVRTSDTTTRGDFTVDGIVELWFADEAAAGAGFGSEVADRLIEDEKRFLSGLMGSAVTSGAPTPDWPLKLWVLAELGDASSDDGQAQDQWVDQQRIAMEAQGSAMNYLDTQAAVLQREALSTMPSLPELAIAFGFDKADVALAQFDFLLEQTQKSTVLRNAQVLLAEELRII